MQLNFSFPSKTDIYDISNFIVHNGNKEIFDFINSSYIANNNIYLLTGAEKSGKTHICKIWNKIKNAYFIDPNIFIYDKKIFIEYLNKNIHENSKYILEDIEKISINEEYLFHLLNKIIEKKAILLITSTKFVKDLTFNTTDLNSRFKNIFNFILKDLDDESKQQIILKLLSDKQLNIDSQVLEIISKKISGNYQTIFDFVESISRLVETNRIKRITLNNIKSLL